ncbi:unnamed protein product, partial [Ascophyllum nodosum]
MQITLGPQYNVGEKPTVILYIYMLLQTHIYMFRCPRVFVPTAHVWYFWMMLIIVFALVLFFPPLRSDRGRLCLLLFFLSFPSFICFLDVAMVWKGK